MRVERQRVGPRQPGQQRPQRLDQMEEGAVRPVDVVPEPLATAQRGDRLQRVDGAGVGRPGRRGDQERPQPHAAVLCDGRAQGVDPHAEMLIDRDRPHPIGQDAGQPGRLGDRGVGLRRGVEDTRAEVGPQQPLAGTEDGVEGGHRAAGGEQAACGGREAHPVAEPVQHVGLQLHQRRGGLPDAGEAVDAVGDQVGQHRREQAAAGDVGQVAGGGRVERAGDPVAEERVEQLLQLGPLLGAGSRSARQRSSACTSPQAGWSPSAAMCSMTRVRTSWPIARIRSGGSSRSAGSSVGGITGDGTPGSWPSPGRRP